MRLRHITGSEEFVSDSPFVIQNPEALKGHFSEKLFFNENPHATQTILVKNKRPLCLEIGMGKGKFIFEMAKRNPERNFIGIERYDSVLFKAIKRREKEEEAGTVLKNLYYMSMDARFLSEVFSAGEVDTIYLNFSDPWPKKRQANRRLTSPVFLKLYEQVLSGDGHIEFKTDNRDLFDYSLESFQENGWDILAKSFDLHHDETLSEGNIMTEYEEKFSAKGNPICKCIAKKNKTREKAE